MNVNTEQHRVSRTTRSAARIAAAVLDTNSSRRRCGSRPLHPGQGGSEQLGDLRHRNGRTDVGNVHASGTHDPDAAPCT